VLHRGFFCIENHVKSEEDARMSLTMSQVEAPPRPMPPIAATSQRLMSLDALRGFDMFWIIAGEALVAALHRMFEAGGHPETGFSITGFLAYELEHADWAGFHFYDLIFPLFVFMAGISVVFSLGKTIRLEGRAAAVKRVFRRSVLLFLLALFYSGGLTNPWPDMRLMGVLNRIALCYFFAGLLFCFCNLRALIAIAVALLVGYWALLTFVPIRNIQLQTPQLEELARKRGVPMDPKALFYSTNERVTGHYEPGLNLVNHIDFQYLPGRLYDTYFDPEGILSTMPAIVTCLLGVFAGLLLLNPSFNDPQKVIFMLAGGMILAALGWAWSAQFPVIKKIWTSSYVLVAGGYSAILLGAFYWMVDVAKYRRWCLPFVWMGTNSITIYMTKNILGGFAGISKRVAGGDIHEFFDTHLHGGGDLVLAIIGLLAAFWFVHFLYGRKIFLRL
jgi:predicted acyltransferase